MWVSPFSLGRNQRLTTRHGPAVPTPLAAVRKDAVGGGMQLKPQAKLLQIVSTLGPAGRLAGRLHRRQEQGDQNADDRDHDQQFDEGKPPRKRILRTGKEELLDTGFSLAGRVPRHALRSLAARIARPAATHILL